MNASIDILLIEDSPSQALRINLGLQRLGYHVCVAADGLQGYWLARTTMPRLVLLDVELPKLNGFQVLQRLKHHPATRTIPVVMLTDRDRLPDVEHALTLGASDYLPKHEASVQLGPVVQQLLDCPPDGS